MEKEKKRRTSTLNLCFFSDMALKLQAWAEDPKIPWLSQKQQQQPGINISLRIGIHAGAICGGVVGSRVPKFVVMGETVNVAARIEAECAPGEIRISSVVMGVIDHAGYLADRLPETIDMKSRGGKLSQFRLVAGPSEG